MSNFIFALNATMPVFLVILVGWFLKKVGLLNDEFCRVGNNYVFKCALPISLFNSISSMDIFTDFKPGFFLFCFFGSIVFFAIAWILSWLFVKDKRMIGAFAQGCCRSSAAILGVAFAVNIYGDSGMVPMMIVGCVPVFNVFAVLILLLSPHVDEEGNLLPKSKEKGWPVIKKALIGVATNPIILGVVIGLPFAIFRITLPAMLTKTLSNIGGTASPVALIIVGASFSGGEALKRLKPALAATAVKLLILPALFLPVACALGFRNSEMVAILIMLGSPTTVASYVMTKKMHNDAVLASNIIVISTLLSSITITLWIYVLKSFGMI